MRRFVSAASLDGPSGRSRRLYQLDSLLQHELGQLITRLVDVPVGVLVSLSQVKVSADLEVAEVSLSILPYERRREVFKMLRVDLNEVQRHLYQRLRLYRVPKIHWTIDETEEKAGRVEALLDNSS